MNAWNVAADDAWDKTNGRLVWRQGVETKGRKEICRALRSLQRVIKTY